MIPGGYGCRAWQQRVASQPIAPKRALSTTRQWLVGGTLAVALVGVTGRLAFWQIARATNLAAIANAQHWQQQTLPSGRGMILDRNGNILALTVSGDAGAWRVEPDGTLAAQVLGFVRIGTDSGQYGVEQSEDAVLAGVPGTLYTAVDAFGDPIDSAHQRVVPAVPGGDVTLTLDADIQALAEQGLQSAIAQTGASGGTVIVEDPRTGDILAMASDPSFDPKQYNAVPLSDLANPAIGAAYDPGSTMKAITMAAGIDASVITPQTAFVDDGSFDAGGQTIYNWGRLAWGPETMTQVLEHSANVGAAWVAVDRLGQTAFDRYLAAFGFGAPTGIDLPGESAGLLAPPETDPDLATLDLAENAFGESLAVTPLQLVMAYGALANGGLLMQPRIVQSVAQNGHSRAIAPRVIRRAIGPATAASVTQMLVESGLHGDAAMGLLPQVAVAAKTGTSTPDPANPSVTYASVVGYFPAQSPHYVVLVKLDHPRTSIFGGAAAGPLWRWLARHLLNLDALTNQGGATS
jgi:cell division protein FtsI/penicillin-binding protein 2